MRHLLLAVAALTLLSRVALADAKLVDRPPAVADLPDELRPWAAWVLDGDVSRFCPVDDGEEGQARCAWPGRLSLDIGEQSGRLEQRWRVYAESLVPLPGGPGRWPQNVRVDGAAAVVVPAEDTPTVRLLPGEHSVTAELAWDTPPEALPVPPETGLLVLTIRGEPVPFAQRAADGTVFLEKRARAEASDAVEVRVYRRVVDSIPLVLVTKVELSVSGKNRELLLGKSLPEGFVPLSLTSPLPARIEPDGRLRVQVRPGTWSVELVARHEGPVTRLVRPVADGPWTEGDEAWVFEAHGELRQVLVEGARAIDPKQVKLPDGWDRLPAYALAAGDALELREQRRGDADPAPDQLSLDRDLWLDFDGGGYTVRDHVAGRLNRSWRLEMSAEAVLGRVAVRGTDQFITRLGEGGEAGGGVGFELRQGTVDLVADSRIDGHAGDVSATSWDTDFDHVVARLHLPPGWRLLHASGADDVRETWLHSWTLLDLFLVLIIAFATGRLFGLAWGALALLALVLIFPERDAPRWIWLAVLAAEALVRVLPAGRVAAVARIARLFTWIALVLIGLIYAVGDVRQGMFPALEPVDGYAFSDGERSVTTVEEPPAPQTELDAREMNAPAIVVDGLDRNSAFASIQGNVDALPRAKKQRLYNVQDYDKNVAAQTGPGVPRWSWRTVPLGWSGPVQRGQRLAFVLLPPAASLVLAIVRVLLLALLILRLIQFRERIWPRLRGRRTPAAALILLAALWPSPARAEVPSDEILTQLKERLLRPAACRPACATSPRLELDVNGDALTVRVEIGAAARTAVPLPGSATQWTPESVVVDGRPTTALRHDENGVLWLALEEGLHQVVLVGRLPPRDVVQLALPLAPRHVAARATGWVVEGLHEDGQADDDLQLTRVRGAETTADSMQPVALPPFVIVERELELALGWSVETRVTRLTPTGSAIVLEVPLLPGESVTTENVRVQGGKALVNMGPQVSQVTWSSVLGEKSPIELTAPTGVAYTEIWRLDVSPVWHAIPTGIPVVFQQDASGDRLPEWRPWPGEKVSIDVVRPTGVPGQTLTLDHALLELTPGARATDARLTLNIRSSRGGPHTVTLPPDAQVTGLEIAGRAQPPRQDGRKVTLPLVPGAQGVVLSWRELRGISTSWRASLVDLGTPAVNLEVAVQPPQDRWILLVTGPRLGPAVLFWSMLLIMIVVALALGRVRATPLRAVHWALLAVGLSQVEIPAAAVVAGWLVVMGLRGGHPETSRPLWFNLRQLGLAAWALVAAGILVVSIHQGLLGHPEMQIRGNGSTSWLLRWMDDRSAGLMPQPLVVSVPLLVYRGAMLAWALWLAIMLLRWARWSWSCFASGGLWRRAARPPVAPPPPATEPPKEPAAE